MYAAAVAAQVYSWHALRLTPGMTSMPLYMLPPITCQGGGGGSVHSPAHVHVRCSAVQACCAPLAAHMGALRGAP